MASPASLYCLKCKEKVAVKADSVKLEKTEFKSKLGKVMTRDTWVGQCDKCGKKVRQFAKGAAPVPADAAPVEGPVAPAQN